MKRLQKYWDGQTPAIRLTVAYVAILAIICVIFSLSLYRLSVDQLEAGLRHQYFRLRPFAGGTIVSPPSPIRAEDELSEGKRRLAAELVYFDLMILLLGTGASYWLAKRTLRPIEDSLEAQSRFTADASHELRTPLTAMQTEIEVALRNPRFTREEARELLTSNLEEVAKLRILSVGLLRLANGDGKELTRSPQSAKDVAGEAIKRAGKPASAKKIKLQNEADSTSLLADRESLVEIVTILLDNAIKYSKEGTRVRVTSGSRGKSGLIMVSDEGIGIKQSDLPHVFERFYRADSSRSQEGYGLGLSIAQKLAHLHHGRIEAKSAVGKGSTFVVELPLA